jgi:soluble lytic murein transglycosylase-like protein
MPILVFALAVFAAFVLPQSSDARPRSSHKPQTETHATAEKVVRKRTERRAARVQARAKEAAQPAQLFDSLFGFFGAHSFAPATARTPSASAGAPAASFGALDARIAQHAAASGVPLELAHRVVKRESGGNPRAVSKGNYGLMQIRLGTARAMGYIGTAAGLLDPDVNMTYAMRYLAGAYRAAGGNHGRAVALYARGYYYEAKAQGFSPYESVGQTTGLAATRPVGLFAAFTPAGHDPHGLYDRYTQN